MPKLRCPRCAVSVRATDAMLSRPVYCPGCGSCLWQPAPPPVQAPAPLPAAVPAGSPPAAPRAVFVGEEERSKTPVIVAGLAVALLALGGLVTVMSGGFGRRSEPSRLVAQPREAPVLIHADDPAPFAAAEPPAPAVSAPKSGQPSLRNAPAAQGSEGWTVDQLCDQLKRKGVAFDVSERRQSSSGLPGVWLSSRGRVVEAVLVEQHPDRETAKLAAAVQSTDKAPAYVWQRFVLSGSNGNFFRRVRAALGM